MADFLNMLVDIRGSHPDNAVPSDGMYWEIAMKPIDGNLGMYGDFIAKYNGIAGRLESTRTLIDNATANFSGASSALNSHVDNEDNPHKVTKAQVGLDLVDNTADIDKPLSTAAVDALSSKYDTSAASILEAKVQDNTDALDFHINGAANGGFGGNTNSNPHNITPTLIGLGNVDNTKDLDKPISTAVATALSAKLDSVTAGDIGLENVDNTSDIDKPVSTAQSQAISAAVSGKADIQALNTHKNDTDNPHSVTKAQVGLSNVDNTSDADKPVSTAQALEIAKKLDAAHGSNTGNPHNVTKAQVGLENVNNTSDANKPISIATAGALSLRPLTTTVVLKTDIEDSLTSASSIKVLSAAQGYQLQQQINDLSGDVTVVAGSITEDAATLSTARKIELVGDATGAVYFDGSQDVQIDVSIPAAPDIVFADILQTPTTLAGYGITDGITPAEVDSRIAVSAFGIKYSVADIAARDAITTPKAGEQAVVQSERYVYRYDGSTWIFFYELDGTHNHDTRYYTKTEVDTALEIAKKLDAAHGSNTGNPHNVTKAQVGLENVNNTSDANKPISIATAGALSLRPLTTTVVLKTDIEDSLTSASSIKVLSAAQGYQLQQQINDLSGDVTVVAGSITEDAATLSTARKIELVGDATGAVYFDGSQDVQIDVSIPAAPDIVFADILQTPTTLAGYGITDGITPAEVDSRIAVSAFGIKYSVADIAARDAITTPKAGEQAVVQSERYVYRYDGSTWIFFYELDGTHNHDTRYYTKTEVDTANAALTNSSGKVGPSLLSVDESALADKSVVSYDAATNKLVYTAPEVQTSEILDSSTAVDRTWSANKINTELAAKMDDVTLAAVATSGSYNDLVDLPAASGGGDTFGPHQYIIDDTAAEQMEAEIAAGNTSNVDALFPVALPSMYTGADDMTMSFFTFQFIIDAVVGNIPPSDSTKFGPNNYTITSASPSDGQVVSWDAGSSSFVYTDAASGSVTINDSSTTSTTEAWSANKINNEVTTLQQSINSISSGGASINDSAVNTTETWSSSKINTEISNINAKTFYDDNTGILYMTTDGTTPGP